jgi:1,4-alpha-glucan branching enzyme
MKRMIMGEISATARTVGNRKTTQRKERAKSIIRGLKKQYLNSTACKVTFRLPKEAAPEAKTVTLVGDFNNWNLTDNQMKKLKNGDFKLTLKLPCNREYRFKYLIDSTRWENDWYADKYIPNPYGGEDSVVVV